MARRLKTLMKFINKIKLFNFKRFSYFEYSARQGRNVFIGDNEAGKSTALQAIDLVLSGSRSRVETLGLESIFNTKVVSEFLSGDKNPGELPSLMIEIYLNDYGERSLEGINNTDKKNLHGLRLICDPMLDEYGVEIAQSLNGESDLFPFEYYSIQFSTFGAQLYTQNRRFINHVLIDSSLIGTEYATKQYTKSLYEANTTIVQRYKNKYAYRLSKASFTKISLKDLNESLGSAKFDVKNDSKSNIEHDLVIKQDEVPVIQMGKGKQCFIKTKFALDQKEGTTPIDLILIEEPENHLSHLNMKKLINQIEKATQTQIFIATHSNSVCSRLDLHNSSLISSTTNTPVSLSDLPEKTANYFIKAPNNKILEFALSEKVLLVEGDSEYILIDGIYFKLYGEKLEDSNIHVISVGGTSFKRYMDLASLLSIKTAVIRDNDGDYQNNCVENYTDYNQSYISVFSDTNDADRTTLELCLYQDNNDLCDGLFLPGRRTLTAQEYMLNNKSDSALKIMEEGIDELKIPDYISQAFEWIRK